MAAEQQQDLEYHTDEASGRGWIVALALLTIVGIVAWLIIANGESTG